MYNELINKISEKSKILFNEPMRKHTTFKVGGEAECFLILNNSEDLINVLSFVKEKNFPLFILGNGSNLLVSDEGIEGVVIKLGDDFQKITAKDNIITAGSGTPLTKVVNFAYENGLTGIEWAYGIPGSLGGAVFMNAGAYGGEMKDLVLETTYLDYGLNICKVEASEHRFEYRKSVFNSGEKNGIILETKLRLNIGDKESIKEKMQEHLDARMSKQPLDMPSAGSIFRRPKGFFVGQMIEELNLKGFSVGGAEVSEKHAGFIVNKGSATARDIKELIQYIKTKVKEKYGVELETEVREVGR